MLLESLSPAEVTVMLSELSVQCERVAQQLSALAHTLGDQLDGAVVTAVVQELFGYVQRLLRAAQQFATLQWQWMLEGY